LCGLSLAARRAAERVLERGQKTAWYSFIHPMRIGALVANGGDRNLDRFNRLGYLLGLAFQITDDVLNLEGSLARYGKKIGGDLWEGKRTLLLTRAVARAGSTDRAWMSGFLARPREAACHARCCGSMI
jgi:geranylgeranyl diphosphate synthase, type II